MKTNTNTNKKNLAVFFKNIKMNSALLSLLFVLFFANEGFAITYYSRAAGPWTTLSSWSTVNHAGAAATSYPIAGDIVYIQHAMTFTDNAACATIYFDGTGTLTPITINTPYSLTVSGTIELTSSPSTTTYTMTGTGTVSCQDINCGTNLGIGTLSNTVTLALKSALSNLTCSNTLTVRANTYGGNKINTEFDLLSGTMNLGYLVVTTEALNVLDAKFTNTGTSTLKFTGTGTVVTKSSGQGGTSATETVDFTGSTVEYVGTANQTIFPTSYKGLRIANTGATATLGGNINVSGNWDNDGTFTASTYNVTFNGTIGQSITGDNTTVFNIIYVNNTNTLTLARNVSATELNYINASGTATFSISTGVTLALSGALKKTSFAGPGNTSVLSGAGNLTCSAIDIGTTSVTGSNTHTTITFTTTLSSLYCSGNLTVTSSYLSSYRVSIVLNINSGTVQVANIIQVKDGGVTNTNQLLNTGSPFDSILKISGATGITAAAAGSTITLTGASSTVEYNGSVAQNVYPTTYNTLKINNTSGCSLTGSASTKNLDLTSGILTTTDTNKLTVTTGTTSGSATSYVNGPLSINRTTITLTPYPTFHVGKGGRYLPVTINSITSTTNPTITIEAFSGDVAGTISASGFCSLSTTEYWNMIYTASSTTNPNNITLTVQRPEALGDLNILTSTDIAAAAASYNTTYVTRGGASITTYSLKNSSVLPATSQPGSKLRLALGSSTKAIGGAANATSTTICNGTTTTITVSGQGSGTIQWQQSSNGTDWGTETGGTGGTTSTYTTPSLTAITYYRAVITGASPCSPTTATSSVATVTITPNIWSGTTSTNWNTASNWLCATVPNSTTNVVIPSGTTNSPNISSANAVANSITINSEATLTMSDSKSLTLTDGSSFTNNGTFTAGTGSIIFAGAGTIAGTNAITANTLEFGGGTITINNTVNATNVTATNNSVLAITSTKKLNITGVFDVADGKTFDAGGVLVLKSDSSNTARVDQMSGVTITGDVTVERYLGITQNAWRLITSPVKSGSYSNTVYGNWQNNGSPQSGTGLEIWGPAGNPTNNGLALANGGSTSLRRWDYGARKFVGVTNTKTELLFSADLNNAFLTFVAFPYSEGTNGSGVVSRDPAFKPTTMSAKGKLLVGDVVHSAIPANNFYLIGNPYASPIDFIKILNDNSTSIQSKIWVLDGSNGTNNNTSFGQYVTIDANQICSLPGSVFNGKIKLQSGQGFFVKGKATGGSVTINESHKTSGNSNTDFNRSAATYEKLRMVLRYTDPLTKVTSSRDGVVSVFGEGYLSTVDEIDASKISGPNEYLGMVNGSSFLSIDYRAPIADGDVLTYKITGISTGKTYELRIYTEDFMTFNGTAYLEDLFLKTKTDLILDGGIVDYPFTVTADALSTGNRFRIVFADKALAVSENSITRSIVVYPNPTNQQGVNINLGILDLGTYEYRMVNLLGQTLQQGTINKINLNQEIALPFTKEIPTGWYALKISAKGKTLVTRPIIVE